VVVRRVRVCVVVGPRAPLVPAAADPPAAEPAVRDLEPGPALRRGSHVSAPPEARSGGASSTAPTVTAANASTRRTPNTPEGTGSPRTIVPAAIGSALVNSVARPATVSAAPF